MSIWRSIVGSLPPATALHYHSNILWALFLMSRSTLQAGSEMSGWTVYLALISSCVMVFLWFVWFGSKDEIKAGLGYSNAYITSPPKWWPLDCSGHRIDFIERNSYTQGESFYRKLHANVQNDSVSLKILWWDWISISYYSCTWLYCIPTVCSISTIHMCKCTIYNSYTEEMP
jgi:hypothetical protein